MVESSNLSGGATPFMPGTHTELIEMLLSRLERVPADSFWAHRACGVRGSLLAALEGAEAGEAGDTRRLSNITREALRILENAANDWSRARPAGSIGTGPTRSAT